MAGRYTDTLNAAPCWVLPLGSRSRPLGAVALRFDPALREPDPDQRSLALAMTQDIGQALERALRWSWRSACWSVVCVVAVSGGAQRDLRLHPLASMIGAAVP